MEGSTRECHLAGRVAQVFGHSTTPAPVVLVCAGFLELEEMGSLTRVQAGDIDHHPP
jgi:hypothetical protein